MKATIFVLDVIPFRLKSGSSPEFLDSGLLNRLNYFSNELTDLHRNEVRAH